MASVFPVRCFTCGKMINNKWDKYESLLKKGKSEDEALDAIKMRRYCCRRMFISHVPEMEKDNAYYSRT